MRWPGVTTRRERSTVAPGALPKDIGALVQYDNGTCASAAHALRRAQHSARSGFLLQGDSPREAIANTGSGWRLLIDSAYAELAVSSQDVRGAYYAATQGELVDGTRSPWGWEGRDYRDEV